MDIITKKLEYIKKEYPIIEMNMKDILVDMVRTSPKQIVHFTRSITVPTTIDTKTKYGPKAIVSMTLDTDKELVFLDINGDEVYEYDVFGGIIAIFTMLDVFGQIKK